MTRRDRTLLIVAVALSLGTFAVDMALPLGVGVDVLYAVPVLLSLWASSSWQTWAAGAHGTVLAALAFTLKDDALAPAWVVSTNRGLALVVIWTASLVVAISHDMRAKLRVTEAEKEARDAALAASRKHLEDVRYALDQAAIVAFTDRAGRITYANDRFCEISGYAREELLGQTHRIVNSGTHPPEFFKEMWRTIGGGRVWRGEVRNRAKDGHLYWVDTTIVPLLGADGRPEQYLSIRTEITERKRAEEALRKQEALARLGEMAAVVAHEVKNPLTGIAGALQVIGNRMPAASAERRVVGDMIERIWSLHRSLQDLLVFARPRAPEPRPMPLTRLLASSLDLLARDARFVRVQTSLEGPELEVEADPDLLREAFLNVLLNAAQATEGGGTVRVVVAEAGAWCRVDVIDDGPGIPPETKDRAFEPFFTTRVRGTGLGLPIVRRTVELHGGTVTLECPPQGGTIVHIEIPVRAMGHQDVASA